MTTNINWTTKDVLYGPQLVSSEIRLTFALDVRSARQRSQKSERTGGIYTRRLTAETRGEAGDFRDDGGLPAVFGEPEFSTERRQALQERDNH